MFWAVSERGRPIPMDPLPLPDGNMALRWTAGHDGGAAGVIVLMARVIPADERPHYDGPLYQTHFLSCPFAGHHRSNRRREPQ